MDAAKLSVQPEIPSWSNAPLEDHKGNRLTDVLTDEVLAQGTKTWFGDVHIHTNYSQCGYPNNMSLEDNLAYAREVAKMDFCCIADHAEHMDDAQYAAYCASIEAANDSGKFATLPGYEWAGREAGPGVGHRNVMFRDRFGPIFRGDDPAYRTPGKLAAGLRKLDVPVIAPRHHPTYMNDWGNFEADLEPVAEIYSSWGSSEFDGNDREMADDGRRGPWPGNYLQDGLVRGCRIGFLGGGDAHSIKPGSSGMTAVICDDLSRESLFDAICNRRCYATTGPRILLDFHINGHPMGSIHTVPWQEWADIHPLKISCAAIGTASIAKIELIENNRVTYTQRRWRSVSDQMAFCISRPDLRYYWRYYYVRVTQADGHMAWSSPIWFLFSDYSEE